jgi:purine/pyrimidine-nucleoside phosphorylase
LPAWPAAVLCDPRLAGTHVLPRNQETQLSMITEKFDGVSVTTKANVYFDGKCVSHAFTLADGTKKSIGVVLPATLSFSTAAAEIMECVGGACEYRLAGTDDWLRSAAGESFQIAANSRFDIRVTEPYHYICHYA